MATPRRARRRLTTYALPLALAGIAGCVDSAAPAANAGATSGDREDLVGGVATSVRPEIGRFSGPSGTACAAVLIAPQWVLTSGRCNGYGFGAAGTFTIATGLDGSHPSPYITDYSHTFGSLLAAADPTELTPDGGNILFNEGYRGMTNDVAIAHLFTPVPASVATPATLGEGPPPTGTNVTLFGYGCSPQAPGGIKQAVGFNTSSVDTMECDDYGGPLVMGSASGAGAIVGVAGGYAAFAYYAFDPDTGLYEPETLAADAYGEATYFRDDIMSIMELYSGSTIDAGFDRPGGDLSNVPSISTAACEATCTSTTGCVAFVFDAATYVCYLKNAIADWQPNPSCTSGILPQQAVGVDRPGGDLPGSPVLGTASADACMTLCAAADTGTTPCVAYAYVAATSTAAAQCWLKSSVPAPVGASAAITSGVERGRLTNINIAGGDYSDFDVSNNSTDGLVACQTSCSTDLECRAYTYTTPGHAGRSNAHCWLKAFVQEPSADVGVTSGVRRGLEQNVNFAGDDFEDFDVLAVPEACQAQCAQNSNCQAFTYTPAGWPLSDGTPRTSAHCWLKSAVPARSTAVGLVSGVRGADFF